MDFRGQQLVDSGGTATYVQSRDLDEVIEDTSAKDRTEVMEGNLPLSFSIAEPEGSQTASNCQRVGIVMKEVGNSAIWLRWPKPTTATRNMSPGLIVSEGDGRGCNSGSLVWSRCNLSTLHGQTGKATMLSR